MSLIGQRVFVLGGNQLYMSLANEEFIRPLGVGSNWTKLRLGVMAAVNPNGTSNILNAIFAIGLCSGTTAGVGAASTTNYLGLNLCNNGLTPATWTYTANSGNPYYSGGASNNPFKKVGAAVTQAGGGTQTTSVATTSGSVQRRGLIYVDIAKGSPNWNIIGWAMSGVQLALDWTFPNLLEGLELNGAPTIGGVALTGGSNVAIAFDETAGQINALSIYWATLAFSMEIYGIGVYRLS